MGKLLGEAMASKDRKIDSLNAEIRDLRKRLGETAEETKLEVGGDMGCLAAMPESPELVQRNLGVAPASLAQDAVKSPAEELERFISREGFKRHLGSYLRA